jgi:predicted transglutaminase-like cysteine proteinase
MARPSVVVSFAAGEQQLARAERCSESQMWKIMSLNAARAILIAWGLSLISPPTELMAGTLTSPVERVDEPFRLSTSTVTAGTVLEKWRDVERRVDDERQALKICEEARASCRSQAALQFLAIVDGARALEGRARLGDVNRAINLKIKPMSDLALYGAEDVWSPPLVTLAKGAGDCEDYAIAKFVALQEAGVSAETFGSSSCGTTSGKKITPLSRRGSMATGSCWTICTWSWSRTSRCGIITARYF